MGEYNQKSSENRQERLTKKARIISTRLLTIIQITVCSIILLTVVFVRLIGGNAYMVVKSWYQQNLNNSIVAEEDIENVKHTVVEFFPPVSSLLPKYDTQSAVSSEQPKGGTAAQQASPENPDSQKAG